MATLNGLSHKAFEPGSWLKPQTRTRGRLFSCFRMDSRHPGAVLVARRIRNRSVVDLKPIKGSRCVLVQETLPSLLSTGWFQEQIRA